MHEKKALRGINPGFALDHMEPMRPVVDRAVLHLLDSVTFTGADFSIQHDGVCRMNPELCSKGVAACLGALRGRRQKRPYTRLTPSVSGVPVERLVKVRTGDSRC